jgi:hypothetical protein
MKVKLFARGLMVVAAAVVAMGRAPGSVMAYQNANANTAAKAKKHSAPKHHSETVGIPSGAGNCVAKLEQLASKEPLTPYEKGPDQIINNGLLWDNPHSKCSVGSDQAVRNKVFAVATAWQKKSADELKTALADLKNSVPAVTEPEHKKPRRHHTAAAKTGATSGAAVKPASANSNSAKSGPKSKSGKNKSANKNSGA